jgi:phosphatidylserine/phosphatidylglycerophosphate/cardiolipin synthase-like enzyme
LEQRNNDINDDGIRLSHVGESAHRALEKDHSHHRNVLWNVTSGNVVEEIHPTPRMAFCNAAAQEKGQDDDWFPNVMADLMKRTNVWCDVLCCTPPDGLFLTKFNEALQVLAAKKCDKPITVRILFGNIIGFPVNLKTAIRELTNGIHSSSQQHTNNMRLWVGVWRAHVAFNHAKIIAVDGQHLWTGGHNWLSQHYLQRNPVHDVSISMQGQVAHDAHLFANHQWDFIKENYGQKWFQRKKLHAFLPLIPMNHVAFRSFPPVNCYESSSIEFPPQYHKNLVCHHPGNVSICNDDDRAAYAVPVVTMGHCGAMVRGRRASDDAFVAVLDSAQSSIRMALQDLGPWTVPRTKIKMPLSTWPHEYLAALGRAIWERQVVVDIILSNPESTPGGLWPLSLGNRYGHGWSCVECAVKIVKTVRKQYPMDVTDDALRQRINDNLRICYIRQKHGNTWEDGNTMALHSKHWIIDDIATYIGSQNMYVCHAADWGVLIDSPEQTQKIMKEFWNPMWEASYTGDDCSAQEVMDKLGKKRSKFSHDLLCGRRQ